MNRAEREKLYKRFLDEWGYQSQALMCIEEMSELTKELCKLERSDQNSEEVKAHIREELADVYNTIEQMMMIYGREEILAIRDAKLERAVKKYHLDSPDVSDTNRVEEIECKQ
jgi:NTP pyrophosphatase (non-canonical NTP hydrolase)